MINTEQLMDEAAALTAELDNLEAQATALKQRQAEIGPLIADVWETNPEAVEALANESTGIGAKLQALKIMIDRVRVRMPNVKVNQLADELAEIVAVANKHKETRLELKQVAKRADEIADAARRTASHHETQEHKARLHAQRVKEQLIKHGIAPEVIATIEQP